ncbi:hypothetical protein ACFJIY_24500 [Pimelobacter simplex]|uniref:hypothetical protein n=1 Tax=Nocardioides simplex TaxID=2045 RepID=UPI0036718E9C
MLLFFGTLVFAIIGRDWAGTKRDDAAQWIMAGASLATLIAACVAAAFAGGAYRIEARREDRLLDGELKHQASRVAAWLSTATFEPVLSGAPNYKAPPQVRDVVRIRNASDLPVTDVVLTYHFQRVQIAVEMLDLVPPALEPYVHRVSSATESAWGTAIDLFVDADGPGVTPPMPTIEIRFTDAAGRRWTRKANGELT